MPPKTLEQLNLFASKNKREGYHCECCGLFVKEYVRSLNCNIALTLIHLYREKVFGWVHVEAFLKDRKLPRSGDFHKAVLYGLLEKKNELREDDSPRNGFYKLTGRGVMWVEGKTKVQKKVIIFNNKVKGFEGEDVTIHDVLGTKFNYHELMNGNG